MLGCFSTVIFEINSGVSAYVPGAGAGAAAVVAVQSVLGGCFFRETILSCWVSHPQADAGGVLTVF